MATPKRLCFNDGLGAVIYLTPTECGVIVSPPNPNEDPDTPPTGTVVDTGTQVIYQLPVIVSGPNAAHYTGISESVEDLPFIPIASVDGIKTEALVKSDDNPMVPAPVVVVTVSSIILIVLFILL